MESSGGMSKKKKLRLPSGFEYGVKRCLVFQAGDELVVCRFFFFFNEENKAKAIMNPRKNKVLQETTLHTSTVIILVI